LHYYFCLELREQFRLWTFAPAASNNLPKLLPD
jgi:hypothetical protein